MRELADLTWPEARAILAPRTVALLPVGTIEPHGPHLPLGADVAIAEAHARAVGGALDRLRVESLLLPPISFGITHYTDGFPGWITLKPATLWALIEDVLASIEQHGIERVVLLNAHLEPAHVKVLRDLCLDRAEPMSGRAQLVFPDHTRRRFAERLGAEFQGGDCHAGSYETSILLAAAPEGVRASYSALAEKKIDLIAKMKAGVGSFLDAGADQAYCGAPAAASAEQGRALLGALADIAILSMREAWPELFE